MSFTRLTSISVEIMPASVLNLCKVETIPHVRLQGCFFYNYFFHVHAKVVMLILPQSCENEAIVVKLKALFLPRVFQGCQMVILKKIVHTHHFLEMLSSYWLIGFDVISHRYWLFFSLQPTVSVLCCLKFYHSWKLANTFSLFSLYKKKNNVMLSALSSMWSSSFVYENKCKTVSLNFKSILNPLNSF